MKSACLLLLSLTLLCSLSAKDDDKDEKKPPRDFVAEANTFLEAETPIKTRKKAAQKWLTETSEEKAELGDRGYYTALAHATSGNIPEGAAALLPHISKHGSLPHHAAAYYKEIDRLLPATLNLAFEKKEAEAISHILQSQLDYTDRPASTLFAAVNRQLKKLEPGDKSTVRSEVVAMLSKLSYLPSADKDRMTAQLYGKRLDTKSEGTATSIAQSNIDGQLFDDPRFLIMGGGSSPSHNQISLEKNVEFLLRVQEHRGFSTNENHILFADGTNTGRDLQMVDEANEPDELHELLAALLASPSGIYYTYRDHEIDNVAGASTEPNIKKYFEDLSITNDQQLVINFTGHGGRGEKNNSLNTSMYLWEGKTLRVKDFCNMLNGVPETNAVMVLMVQCFSGGFSNIIFKEGNPDKGLSDHARCGFFATVHDRVAAGCTPAIDEADYREYSSYFLAALTGIDRVGRSFPPPDYDGDGTVCFAEAHAYALITSETLDISVKTTDAFLRKYSKVDPELLGTDNYRHLLAHAGPNERAVLEGLSRSLQLHGDARTSTARARAKDLESARKKNDGKRSETKKANVEIRNEIRKALRANWPELFSPWHPAINDIMSEQSNDVLKVIQEHPKYAEYEANWEQQEKLSDKHYEMEVTWAKLQRFIRTAENVALETNLPNAANPAMQKRYQELKKLEHGTLKGPNPIKTPKKMAH